MLYWSIDDDTLERQREAGWGAKVIERLAADLKREFPQMTGRSRSNIMCMRPFAEAWPEGVPRAVGQRPWVHARVLMDRLTSRSDRDWYAERAVAEGWSRAVLQHKIKADLRSAIGAAPSSSTAALDARSPIEGGAEFIIDLLLFHVEQLRYVVIELKVGDLSPAHLGQFGAYVAAVDGELRRPTIHAPTIGILLCTGKNEAAVRYALASTAAPVAVADYQGLPEDARAALPSARELQAVVDAEVHPHP